MYPTRVLRMQPTRALMRPVPVSVGKFGKQYTADLICRKRSTAVLSHQEPST